MDAAAITQSPFAVLTFIVAPAILTNATSVLGMSTINRMLRTRERMQQLYSESKAAPGYCGEDFLAQVDSVERQAVLLLGAMRSIYVSLGSFAAAALVTLLGAVIGALETGIVVRVVVGTGLLLGFVGVSGLVSGCLKLFQATRLSMTTIREEANLIRLRQSERKRGA